MRELFEAIDTICITPVSDIGDCRNRRVQISANGDYSERYTRLGLGAGPHWARVETNERAMFYSRESGLGITIALRDDGTFSFIPPNRDIEDYRKIIKYFVEKGLLEAES